MKLSEIYTGKSKCANVFKIFNQLLKKLLYHTMFDIGIITINDYIDKNYKKHKI